eukprot:TRINITY_DN3414_c0_g1_i1.p1 TRINITY_DN3414_c0_g1~~TRINITY_DN3414_c0_g1_i1.p1  ORF type:complete len:69 (+),score=4.20 TRINITY_DN3414_c0_g1_i1:186-392(+)
MCDTYTNVTYKMRQWCYITKYEIPKHGGGNVISHQINFDVSLSSPHFGRLSKKIAILLAKSESPRSSG